MNFLLKNPEFEDVEFSSFDVSDLEQLPSPLPYSLRSSPSSSYSSSHTINPQIPIISPLISSVAATESLCAQLPSFSLSVPIISPVPARPPAVNVLVVSHPIITPPPAPTVVAAAKRSVAQKAPRSARKDTTTAPAPPPKRKRGRPRKTASAAAKQVQPKFTIVKTPRRRRARYSVMNFQCDVCDKWFATVYNRDRHRSNFHPHYDSDSS